MEEIIEFEAFREQWLQDVKAGSPSPVELGLRFARKLFTQWRDISETSEDLIYCDGSNDGGIDLAYLEHGEADSDASSGDIWYLVQSKFGKAFQGQKTLQLDAQRVVEAIASAPAQLSEAARDVLTRVDQFRHQAQTTGRALDRIILVFATELPLAEADKRALDSVRAAGRNQFGPIFDIEAVSIETIYLNTLDEIAAAEATRLRLPLKAKLTPSGDNLWIGSVSLLDLYAFLKEYRAHTGDLDQLYEKNVRLFLGGRKKVNKGIQKTLQDVPEFFGLYNNGITFVVKQFEPAQGDTIHQLSEPYIVNGCQTTRTIWEVFQQKLETGGQGPDLSIEAWKNRAANGVAVIKIVRVGTTPNSGDFLQNITRFTNSQNAVSEKDFITLENTFQRLKREMEGQYGIFLEIQRGGWDSRRALQKQNPSWRQFGNTEWANAFDLLKVYGAGWLREAGTAFGRNAAFVPGGPLYRRIVEKGDEPFGAEDLYAAYVLQTAADQNGFGRGSRKASRRQTRFLFYLIAIELLKDVLIRANLPATHKNLTRSLVRLAEAGHHDAYEAFVESAGGVIDEYLTSGEEDSVFTEPAFIDAEQFNNNLNGYLKWDQLGQPDASPVLHSLLAINKRTMGRGKPSPREMIASAVQ